MDESFTTPDLPRGTRNLAIYILLAAAFAAILNETIMSVAIPVIKDDLQITSATAQWLTTAFMLTMSVVIPISGFLIDRFSTRQMFIGAMGLFVAGTLIGAVAPAFVFVVLGRAIQACGTAIMMPLLMTTVLRLVPEHERGQMMGNLTLVIAVAPAIGPAASGQILAMFNNQWHMLFWTMVPISVLVLVAGALLIPDVGQRSDKRIDVLSVVLSAVGFGGLIYALSLVGQPKVWQLAVALVLGVAALVWFVRRQLRLGHAEQALLDLRCFRTRSFRLSTMVLSAGMVSMFGLIILLPLSMALMGYDVRTIGLSLMPGALIMGLMGPSVGRVYDKYGPRALVISGATLVFLGIAGLAWRLGLDMPLWEIIFCHVLVEIGLGFLFTPLFSWGLGELPMSRYADGSAIVSTLQQVFGGVGTALYVAVGVVATSVIVGGGVAGGAVASDAQVMSGYRVAFVVGAVIALGVVGLATRVKRTIKLD
ncbi:DHA2 family efflux MFS transporter permease subunit [Corynebacterium ulceribovis]|uniref:DHA2 family efflux MFS transporter permease subunit n=1 Tax=Corynebacterium ulceribovis TaxID=487732 RepID=UPI00039C9904|nr:DHA2 family efflux MFS transporter permease subunit [Corynebacterium ulceribovis]